MQWYITDIDRENVYDAATKRDAGTCNFMYWLQARPPKLGRNATTGDANAAPSVTLGLTLHYALPSGGQGDFDSGGNEGGEEEEDGLEGGNGGRLVHVTHSLPIHVANAPEVTDAVKKEYAVIGERFEYAVPQVAGGFAPITYFRAGPPRSMITDPLNAHAYNTVEDAEDKQGRLYATHFRYPPTSLLSFFFWFSFGLVLVWFWIG